MHRFWQTECQSLKLQCNTKNKMYCCLQTERESLKMQCDNLQRELASTSDLHNQLTSRVHELEKDNIILKNRADEVTHKSKVEITNLKMDVLKERGDLQRSRDTLKNHLEGMSLCHTMASFERNLHTQISG